MGGKPRAKPKPIRLPPGSLLHHLEGKPGRNGKAPVEPRAFACGAKALRTGTNIAVNEGVYDWPMVDCMKCLALAPAEYQEHYWGGRSHQGRNDPFACGSTKGMSGFPGELSCPTCIEYLKTLKAPEILEDSARIIITNALLAARKDGYVLTRNRCNKCQSWAKKKGVKEACVACAVVMFRDLDAKKMVEDEIARVLALPYDWVMDMMSGWDGDTAFTPAYRTAKNLGRRLYRRYGKKVRRA